ncbi:MAG: HAD-IIIA family hydrolase [Nitrospinae bacterium]|nr:HAD-IIIA family hydrolase [Nitrospinota bacterium]
MSRLITADEFTEKAKKIKNIILDIDGVLTDGKIYISVRGEESLAFNVRDGLGIVEAMNFGLEFWIITGRTSDAVSARMEDLKVKNVFRGVLNKIEKYRELVKEKKLTVENTAYIGDDVIDLPLLKEVGLSASVANGHKEVLKDVHWISTYNGGESAVREFIDLILEAQGKKIQY